MRGGHKQVGSPMEIREPLSVYKYLCFDHLGGVFVTIFFIVSIPALMYFSVIGRSRCWPSTCGMVSRINRGCKVFSENPPPLTDSIYNWLAPNAAPVFH